MLATVLQSVPSVKTSRRFLFLLPILAFLLMARTLLIAVLCGFIFAVALGPLCSLLRRRLGRARGLAPLLVVLGALTVVALPIVACVALGTDDITVLSERLGELQLRDVSTETTRM